MIGSQKIAGRFSLALQDDPVEFDDLVECVRIGKMAADHTGRFIDFERLSIHAFRQICDDSSRRQIAPLKCGGQSGSKCLALLVDSAGQSGVLVGESGTIIRRSGWIHHVDPTEGWR